MNHSEIIRRLLQARDWRFLALLLWLAWESFPKRTALLVLSCYLSGH